MATDDHDLEHLKVRTERLEAELWEHKRRSAVLQNELDELRHMVAEDGRRHRAGSLLQNGYVISGFFVIIVAILALVLTSQILQYRLEILRLRAAPSFPVQGLAAPSGPRSATPSPARGNAQAGSDPETQQASRVVIERFIDQSTGSGVAGSLATVSLSALAAFIGTLEKGGAIAAETASGIVKDLSKEAGSALMDISKDAAKAVIAKYLGPKPEANAPAALPGHVVLVNVHTGERPAASRSTRKASPHPVVSCTTVPAKVAERPAPNG